MAFNRLYKNIENLVRTNDEVADNIPCKADILNIRECRKDEKVRKFSIPGCEAYLLRSKIIYEA